MGFMERIRMLDPRPLKGQRLADLKAALDENALLRQHAAKQITDATLMTGINIHGGGMDIGMKGGAAGLLAEMLASQFKEGGGVNYLELSFESREVIPDEKFIVTIQRVYGETPAQQIKKLRAEIASYSKDRKSDSKVSGCYAESSTKLAEWTGLEPATPGVTGRG